MRAGEKGLSAIETGNIFQVFARLFQQAPDEHLLEFIFNNQFLTNASGSSQVLEQAEWVNQTQEIAVEFACLFLVPGNDFIPAYESYFCDELQIDTSTACSPYFQPAPIPQAAKGFLCGPSLVSVKTFYAQEGFEVSNTFHDLADHIGVELEFLGRLLVAGRPQKAQQFWHSHLGRWMDPFLAQLKAQERSRFYRAVAMSLYESRLDAFFTQANAMAP